MVSGRIDRLLRILQCAPWFRILMDDDLESYQERVVSGAVSVLFQLGLALVILALLDLTVISVSPTVFILTIVFGLCAAFGVIGSNRDL
jgi:hypothetical protein